MARLLEGLAPAKITHFAAEARALHADDLRDFTLPKRLTLLVCLIHQETISTRDEIADMFLKRMSKLHDRAREELERLRASERKVTEHLVDVLADLLQATSEAEDDTKIGSQVREVFQREGGIAALQEQCEQVSAHHGNRHQPLLWRFYASHRKALFRVLKVLDIHATTADHSLMDAVTFIRQHLETCVLTYVATELKTGDLCIRGSEQFADYRDQLLSWEVCEPQVADY